MKFVALVLTALLAHANVGGVALNHKAVRLIKAYSEKVHNFVEAVDVHQVMALSEGARVKYSMKHMSGTITRPL